MTTEQLTLDALHEARALAFTEALYAITWLRSRGYDTSDFEAIIADLEGILLHLRDCRESGCASSAHHEVPR